MRVQIDRILPEVRVGILIACQVVSNHSHLHPRRLLGRLDGYQALSVARFLTAMTTTTGRPCFASVTGSARTRSIIRPKLYFASFAFRVFTALQAGPKLVEEVPNYVEAKRSSIFLATEIALVPRAGSTAHCRRSERSVLFPSCASTSMARFKLYRRSNPEWCQK